MQAESIQGLQYTGNGYDIVSVDPTTGDRTTLIANAFEDYYGGSFVTDPRSGIGSVITVKPRDFSAPPMLLQYSLGSGKILNRSPLTFGGPLAVGAGDLLVGAHYQASGMVDIETINPKTGKSSALVRDAFVDYWGGSFISDPSADIGYAITETKTLLRYRLSTGKRLPSPKLDFGGPLALGLNGWLVGIRSPREGVCDIVSVNPETGATRTLVARAFSDYWFGTFSTDREAKRGYVLTSANVLFQFDLETGEELGRSPVSGRIRNLAFARKAAVRPVPKLVYPAGARFLYTRKSVLFLRGRVNGEVTSVSYRFGAGKPLRQAALTGRFWKIKVRPGLSSKVLRIVAKGPNGGSEPLRIWITRY